MPRGSCPLEEEAQQSLSSTVKLTSLNCSSETHCTEREVNVRVNTDSKFSTPPSLLKLTKDSWSSSPATVKLEVLNCSCSDTNWSDSEVDGKVNDDYVCSTTSPSLLKFDRDSLSSSFPLKLHTLDTSSETYWTESDCKVDGQAAHTNHDCCTTSPSLLLFDQDSLSSSSPLKLHTLGTSSETYWTESDCEVDGQGAHTNHDCCTTSPSLLQFDQDSLSSSSPLKLHTLGTSSETYWTESDCEVDGQGAHTNHDCCTTSPSLLQFDQDSLSSSSPLKLHTLGTSSETYWTESDCEVDGQGDHTNNDCSTSSTTRLHNTLPSMAKLSPNSSVREVRRSNSKVKELSDTYSNSNDVSEDGSIVVASVKRKRRFNWNLNEDEDEIFDWEGGLPFNDDASAKVRTCLPKYEDEKLKAGCFVYVEKMNEKEVADLQGKRHIKDDDLGKNGKRVYNLRKRKPVNDMRGKRIVTKYRRIVLQSEEE